MDYLPLFIRLNGRACLVVGGGIVAERKIRLLLRAHGAITVVAKTASPALQALAKSGQISLTERAFVANDLDGCDFVIAATDDVDLNSQIAAAARERRCFCNVVDNPELSSAILPAIIDRSPIVVAISSGGLSPVLATQTRQRIDRELHSNLGKLAEWAGGWRTEVKQRITVAAERLRFWQDTLGSQIAERVLAGDTDTADAALAQQIDGWGDKPSARGIGWLVGAGPGDPELLTLKALRCLSSADVVIHDRLVSRAILDYARRDAEIISVGKVAGKTTIEQAAIGELLVAKVKAGLRVCRLKGGDPFIFGRGGEEVEALADAGLDYAVVPGITAAAGCAAALAVPLTHRDVARSVTYVTGQNAADDEPDWSRLTGADQTVVMYMSLRTLERACEQLIKYGRSAECPALLVENGTTPQQRALVGNLTDLPARAREAVFTSPALLVVGDVAGWARNAGALLRDGAASAEQPWLPAATPASNLRL